MTKKSKPSLPENISIRDKYEPAMEIETQEEADAYFRLCVQHTMQLPPATIDREEAECIERNNIGYYAGYFSHETRERVERLFKCEHPVFGAIAKKGPPTPEEALRKGMELGSRQR